MRRATYPLWLICASFVVALVGACAHGPVTATDTSDETQGDAALHVTDGAVSHEAATPDEDGGADARVIDPLDASPFPSPPPPPVDAAPPADASTCTRVGPGQACGVAPQCGCSANQTCDLNGTGDSSCVGPAGLGVAGNHCVNAAACQVGLTCGYGQSCRPFCKTPGQACGGSNLGTCIQLKDRNGGAVPNFFVCEIKCELQDPSSCGFGSGCFQSSVTVGASDCYSAGTKGLNQVCVYADDCQAGYGCVGFGGGTYRCKKWCRVGQSDCGGTTCAGFSPALVVNGVSYGTCP